jgi:RNA polymerase sigma factor (sigma-70 family)
MVNGRTSGAMRQLASVFQEGTLAGLSDREVLGRFADGRHEAAFEVLLGRHGPMVLNVCRRILRDPDDAEDAFQATFLALACKAGSLRLVDSLGPWLYRVANRVAARARADRRRRGDRERSGGSMPEPAGPAVGDDPDRDEVPRVVHEELGRLPERLRSPIVLCYLEGMTHEQAAQQLGCPVGTVRSRMARARALLRRRIARRGLVTSSVAIGAVLASNACASAVPMRIQRSLVKVAAQIAAGTASLRGGCGVPARVAALLEGVLKVFRAKQIASSTAALAAVGIVAAVVGLSVFSASGQTRDLPDGRRIDEPGRRAKPAPVETYVQTYYIGDLVSAKPILRQTFPVGETPIASQPMLDVSPVVDLITSTVARGTWTIHDGRETPLTAPGAPTTPGPRDARPQTVGHITPFFLSYSLIIRHTADVHDEVGKLLRKLRRVVEAREQNGGAGRYDGQIEEERLIPGIVPDPAPPASPATRPQVSPAMPDNKKAASAPPDRNARIRQLMEDLRREVEKLPKDND